MRCLPQFARLPATRAGSWSRDFLQNRTRLFARCLMRWEGVRCRRRARADDTELRVSPAGAASLRLDRLKLNVPSLENGGGVPFLPSDAVAGAERSCLKNTV